MQTVTTAVPVFPLRADLELSGSFRGPEYLGGLLRGGFGKYFRDLSCMTQAETCEHCTAANSCSYSRVFETPVDPEVFPVLRKYPNAPHPFVLAPEMGSAQDLRAGGVIPLFLTLVGGGVQYLPHFLAVLEAMGREGRFGGRFRIREVVEAATGRAVYEGRARRILIAPAVWSAEVGLAKAVERMKIRFVTPLRMRTQGEYTTDPSFAELTQALLRRIHLLRALYGDGEAETGWMKPLLAAADGAWVETANWRAFTLNRMSGRQHRKVPMDGILGEMVVRGELTELHRWYRLGEWVHVGNGTSMGLGRFRVEVG